MCISIDHFFIVSICNEILPRRFISQGKDDVNRLATSFAEVRYFSSSLTNFALSNM